MVHACMTIIGMWKGSQTLELWLPLLVLSSSHLQPPTDCPYGAVREAWRAVRSHIVIHEGSNQALLSLVLLSDLSRTMSLPVEANFLPVRPCLRFVFGTDHDNLAAAYPGRHP